MDHYTIVTSLKRIDKKFTQELTQSQKQAAFRKFKLLYAQQMAKLAGEISKRQKIQENLSQINEKQLNKTKEIDIEIKKKMEKSNLNREKYQQNMEKEIQMLDENWKKKMEDIKRKNRQKQKESIRKAEKIRKEGEQFWKKKSLTSRQNKDDISTNSNKLEAFYPNNKQNVGSYSLAVPNNYLAVPNSQNPQDKKSSEKYFISTKTEEKKLKFLLPDLKKAKVNLMMKQATTLNESFSQLNKSDDIKIHQDRTERIRRDRQEANFQNIMQKLDKIEKTRKNAQQKLQSQVKQAKRIRQLKESPEVHKANRQKSIEKLHSKSRKKRLDKSMNSKVSLSASKESLSKSIQKHLDVKKRISEYEFHDREKVYEKKMQRIKHSKINRLVKEAINQLKQKTLNEKQ